MLLGQPCAQPTSVAEGEHAPPSKVLRVEDVENGQKRFEANWQAEGLVVNFPTQVWSSELQRIDHPIKSAPAHGTGTFKENSAIGCRGFKLEVSPPFFAHLFKHRDIFSVEPGDFLLYKIRCIPSSWDN